MNNLSIGVSYVQTVSIFGSKSIFQSNINRNSTPAVKMASCRKRLQSKYEIERMLEDSASEGDNVFSEDENSFRSESESQSES